MQKVGWMFNTCNIIFHSSHTMKAQVAQHEGYMCSILYMPWFVRSHDHIHVFIHSVSSPSSLSDCLTILRQKAGLPSPSTIHEWFSVERTTIDVCRSHILSYSLREMKKSRFHHGYLLKVRRSWFCSG